MTAAAAAEAAARNAAALAARRSYGRLVALLAYQWRDLAAAEDALGDAFATALRVWPRDGVPAAPDAWLLTVARRQLLQVARRQRLATDPAVTALLHDEPQAPTPDAVPDQRLQLLFVCAHPALAEAVRAPLMLQAVLGLDAAAIASAFLVSPAAMAQRLVRAKAKIRDAGLRFDPPEARELPARLHSVLDSIYGAYTIGSRTAAEAAAGGPTPAGALADEAVFLAELVVALQPDSAEARGLLALLLFCRARRPAQFDGDGRFVPLARQDPARWSRADLVSAEQCLHAAARLRQPGAFQLEAAIQSAHCQRAFGGSTPWPAIAQLYGALVQQAPSIGARIGQAVALTEAGALDAAAATLQALPQQAVGDHQPYWVALAHLRQRIGDAAGAADALRRAIGLTEDPRVRAHLLAQLQPAPGRADGPPP